MYIVSMYLPGGSGSFCNLIQVDLCKRDGFRLLLLHLHHLWSMQDPLQAFCSLKGTPKRDLIFFIWAERHPMVHCMYNMVRKNIRDKFYSKAYELYSFAYVLHYSWMSTHRHKACLWKRKCFSSSMWLPFGESLSCTVFCLYCSINIIMSAIDIPCTLFPQLSDFHSPYTLQGYSTCYKSYPL